MTTLVSNWPATSALLCLVVVLTYFIYQKYRPNLTSIPGPFLASFTDLWRLLAVLEGRFEIVLQRQHEKHGDFVRIGPNCISVGNASSVKQIYSTSNVFPKSDFYKTAQLLMNGKRVTSLFTILDEDAHKTAKRPIAHAYALSNLLDYEPLVDSTSVKFSEVLTGQYVNTNKVCDFGQWLQYYAFDVLGEITFSQRLGFLEHGKDVDGIIDTVHTLGAYATIVGQMPWLDYVLAKNRIWGEYLTRRAYSVPKFVMQFLKPRLDELEKEHEKNGGELSLDGKGRQDITAKLIAASDKYEGKIPPTQLLGWSISNINAGSDTTAIALRAIFHFLLTNPAAMKKLMAELNAANLSPLPSWRETSDLPYLNGVIKEALRLHTPVGLVLERIVPKGGATICDHFFPEDTIVGCNPVVIHMDKRVYGHRYPVSEYRPERWLEAEGEEKSEMDRCFLAFGGGKRVCLGKNISLLEIHKLVPLLLLKFKFRLVDPERKLKTLNRFLVHQTGLDVYIEKA